MFAKALGETHQELPADRLGAATRTPFVMVDEVAHGIWLTYGRPARTFPGRHGRRRTWRGIAPLLDAVMDFKRW